ncbi:YihY/virulence factor BrkB family protein [Streptomyces turgidiscabies]|uniref:YihY family protein n=1 Tax=Streptomyces turgidiscabies (strain Car8) TaxID=698760 RepID=L7FCR1_STRT8|nr:MULTISPECIES: YihY/virulence factor BrkB family protein [Streptomyces]ELP69042.1 YihY family protein [Streptomyces turgidiscabies Car8]MDX3498252.1 YihY/virulence factor BrkB family protein [Streptomyces turgidiscabies]GAQ75225.1 ribonuclease BN/unknown domain fusion protein [Streptomyces turgidiscabies]
MGTAVHVPQTRDMIGEELSGDEALTALRRYGGVRLLVDSFTRFRYADGFTNARALAFQIVLGLVPLSLALVGLATSVHTEVVGRVIERALGDIVPGAGAGVLDEAFAGTRRSAHGDVWSTLSLWLGLAFAVLNLASAMGQIERGANRIYGIERDRPFTHKYGRALLLSVAGGLPMVLGFMVLVAGEAVGDAVAETVGSPGDGTRWWVALEIPVGLTLAWIASAVIFRWSPRRRQPGYTWLAFGSGVHLVLWLSATWLLALYVGKSAAFGAVYGPLTAFVALLLWANVTGVALFLGIAFAAQLEAQRAGIESAVRPDPGPGA